MTATPVIATAEELLAAGDSVGCCELVRGKFIKLQTGGGLHGYVTARIAYAISSWVMTRMAGRVYAAGTGFLLERKPDSVRAADVAFICPEHRAAAETAGFIPVAPDLAVETLSPEDRTSDVAAKVRWWLDHSARMVWVVDPANQWVTEHLSDGQIRVYRRADVLSGGEVLPGFNLALNELFN